MGRAAGGIASAGRAAARRWASASSQQAAAAGRQSASSSGANTATARAAAGPRQPASAAARARPGEQTRGFSADATRSQQAASESGVLRRYRNRNGGLAARTPEALARLLAHLCTAVVFDDDDDGT